MKRSTVIAACILALCLGLFAVARYGALPPLERGIVSPASVDTSDTNLGKIIGQMTVAHPGVSGIYPLLDPRDAFAARELLVRRAERTLDISYYIWRSDISGTLLLAAICAAAD